MLKTTNLLTNFKHHNVPTADIVDVCEFIIEAARNANDETRTTIIETALDYSDAVIVLAEQRGEDTARGFKLVDDIYEIFNAHAG